MQARLALLFALLCCGCARLGPTRSLQKLDPQKEARNHETLSRWASDLVGTQDRILVVGHKAGACETYPHDIEKPCPNPFRSSLELVSEAARSGTFDGLELDVVADPGRTEAYVFHTPPDWSWIDKHAPETRKKLSRLGAVLNAFADNASEGQRIFVEAKVREADDVPARERKELVEAVLAELKMATRLRPHSLTFTSFSWVVLKELRDAVNGAFPQLAVRYHLIVGPSGLKGWLSSTFGDITSFSQARAQQQELGWVDGLWFSPGNVGAEEFDALRARIAELRPADAPPLELFGDTYLAERSEADPMLARLAKARGLTGVVVDVAADASVRNNNGSCP